jgi:hypothetical protein
LADRGPTWLGRRAIFLLSSPLHAAGHRALNLLISFVLARAFSVVALETASRACINIKNEKGKREFGGLGPYYRKSTFSMHGINKYHSLIIIEIM